MAQINKKKILLFFWISLCSIYPLTFFAQSEYKIDLDVPDKVIKTGHLKLGGSRPDGGSIAVNSYFMEMDNKPFIPIMGEIHYVRIPHKYWEEQILKVKSGGVNVICTYVFWNIHEEEEGVFDWEGDKNLREFITLCQKHQMKTIVRVGPFCHGEIRNGGLPDWLYGRPFLIRTNDENYLKYVDRLYKSIAQQLEGLYYKDGGCIIGIQLENELQHSAAPWAIRYPDQPIDYTVADFDAQNTKFGVSNQDLPIHSPEAGNRHLKTLKEIAIRHGMNVPIYTATGWGNAAIIPHEIIPVTAAYTYPTWTPPSMSPFYLFKDIHIEPDYSPVRYEGVEYPSFCAEMGVGIQITYGRRPRIPSEAGEGFMIRSLGSGANGIGYYMYHGGITPIGKNGFLSDEASGVPKMSYDFQAPIGEFGHTKDSYKSLRIIHNFVNDFGSKLAPMGVVFPENYDTISPSNTNILRYAVRKKGESGFIFITNFQDHCKREKLDDISLTLQLQNRKIRLPHNGSFSVEENTNMILPFNLEMNGALLIAATAQPLSIINYEEITHYFFFAIDGIEPEFIFEYKNNVSGIQKIKPTPGLNSTFEVETNNKKKILITTLTREQALNSSKITSGSDELLLITKSDVLQEDNLNYKLLSTDISFNAVIFPQKKISSENTCKFIKNKHYTKIAIQNKEKEVIPIIHTASDRRFQLQLPNNSFEGVSDLILSIDYIADTGAAFISGKMIADNFYNGNNWDIGLKRYAEAVQNEGIYFYMQRLFENATFLEDLPEDIKLDFSNEGICHINNIIIIPEYSVTLKIEKNESTKSIN